MHSPTPQIIPADLLLTAYRSGIFPMADTREEAEIYWVEPRERGVIPLEGFRCSRSLAKAIRQDRFTVTCNADFNGVIDACADPRPGHPETWISHRIAASFRELHRRGHAHSLECWQDGRLVGGLYGLGFDRVFCGESMFSRVPDASKVALAWLVVLLRHAGYQLLDCQFMTDHLESLGAIAIPREEYLARLTAAAREGPAPALPEAYASLLSPAAGSGVAAGAGSGDGAGVGEDAGDGAAAAVPAASGAGPSSPGKLIAQSLTQTS